jgi:hypothetical protein
MIGHDRMTAAAFEMAVDPEVDAIFVEEHKDGLVIGPSKSLV